MAQKDVLDYIRETPHNSNVNVVRGMLNGLDDGGSLPTVTASDNGMVLTVVEGAWDKAASSGGGQPLLIHSSVIDGFDVLDKTWSELEEAIFNGRPLLLALGSETNQISYSSFSYYLKDVSNNTRSIYFSDGEGYATIDAFGEYPAYDPG